MSIFTFLNKTAFPIPPKNVKLKVLFIYLNFDVEHNEGTKNAHVSICPPLMKKCSSITPIPPNPWKCKVIFWSKMCVINTHWSVTSNVMLSKFAIEFDSFTEVWSHPKASKRWWWCVSMWHLMLDDCHCCKGCICLVGWLGAVGTPRQFPSLIHTHTCFPSLSLSLSLSLLPYSDLLARWMAGCSSWVWELLVYCDTFQKNEWE